MMNQEQARLIEAREKKNPWKKWGPYLSERQWGTVREDYSDDGNAWDYFTHDQARSRIYRWGEDGLAGISDDQQRLCFALALWNGNDPIIKERLFGLTNSEGNHGEDVKEYYFYLDSTPTHSYMKYLYKYPYVFPYDELVETNKRRSRHELEYELIDTGAFDEDRYFDVFVEYAKETPEDILIRITAINRGSQKFVLHVLPTIWFRNFWFLNDGVERPQLAEESDSSEFSVVKAMDSDLGERYLVTTAGIPFLFTENETNQERLWGRPNSARFVKDGIHEFLVRQRVDAVNPDKTGTKASAHFELSLDAGESREIRLRLSNQSPSSRRNADILGRSFEQIFQTRQQEADEFYASIAPPLLNADQRNVMRQALAGMLWSKQFFYYDLDQWLKEHEAHPLLLANRPQTRNNNWFHMLNRDVISMPDKWEYPWYAAWDLAFHTIALAAVDIDFAKQQMELMFHELYLHPSGQIPAYEWNFGDVNPPVHAWATYFIFQTEQLQNGKGDIDFLKRAFQKLLLNFTWWVNRKDPSGRNVFEGGFLGLDNIGVFDRSSPLPTGGYLEQADGTAWMALYSQNMLQIALELAHQDSTYEDLALKFVEHFLWIAGAMDRMGERHDEMWDEEDGFYYDLLRLPDGSAKRLKVRSMVGLLPLCAVTVIGEDQRKKFPEMTHRVRRFLKKHPELVANINPPTREGVGGTRMLSILDETKLKRVLSRMLDENEFLSPYGIRALSRFHRDNPYVLVVGDQEYRVDYLPAESNTGMFGGNSNWRGPIWFPVNGLIIRALLQLYTFYGTDFQVECPTGSGRKMNLFEVAMDLCDRLAAIFLRDKNGRRPVYGGTEKFQTDPNWRDNILFYEYFHADNGAGLGASHQTGWTGLIAKLIQMRGYSTEEEILRVRVKEAVASESGKDR